ncbi:phage terminase large subunit family protein [Listeria rocourtiae]|nr:phage terminase large subunit family protein [Listeria rocourtiae]
MDGPMHCPSCGEEMNNWINSIYECPDCGCMMDTDAMEEDEF